MPFTWQRRPTEAFPALTQAYAQHIHRGVVRLAERYAVEIEQYMKDNAVWTDRSGLARQTLFSEVTDIANSAVIIILGHGVDWGIFLELANGGRFSILFPTMDYFLPRIWNDVQALVRR